MQGKWRVQITIVLVVICCLARAQAQDVPGGWTLTRPNEEVRVTPLPSVAASRSPSDVLLASVEIASMDPAVCCGRNSALEDEAVLGGNTSLKELGEKLRGKHYLDSGQTITVTDQYWSGAAANAGWIIGSLAAQRPLLLDWDDHVYVIYGAVFDEYAYSSGGVTDVVKKLLLVDTRYSGKRRYVVFDRQSDDWNKVTGLLALNVTR